MTAIGCLLLLGLWGDDPAVERTREPVPEKGPVISVRGLVKTPEGVPIPGAIVVLRVKASVVPIDGLLHMRDVLARTKTNQEGAFHFENVAIPPRFADSIGALQRHQSGAEIVAWAQDRALAWTDVTELSSSPAATLVLGPEADLHGILKDAAGNGIPQVRVSVTGITPATRSIDHFFRSPGDTNPFMSEIEPATFTDQEGRFVLRHLPKNYRLAMVLDHAAFARELLVVDTGNDRGLSEISVGESGVTNPMKWPMKRLPLEMSLRRGPSALVKVTDSAGKPVTSGTVSMLEGGGFSGAALSATGEARVRIVSKGLGKYRFRYTADPLDPALSVIATAEIEESGDKPVELRLPEPLWLKGKVINPETKEGVVGVSVSYYSPTGVGGNPVSSAAISGQAGGFKIPVIAGRGTLGIAREIYGYLTPSYYPGSGGPRALGTTVEIPATGAIEPVTLKLARGLVVRGVVSDKDGKPVAGAAVSAHNNDQPFRSARTKTDAAGKYELAALSPHVETYVIAFSDAGSTYAKLDGAKDQAWDESRPVETNLKLQPGVILSGQAFRDARPRAGIQLRLIRGVRENKGRNFLFGEAVTDAEGRYRFAGLSAGDQYHIEIVDPDGLVASGWRHQSPYRSTAPSGPEITLPDMHLVALNQRLAGIVVDPKGKPLAGIVVSAEMADRSSIPRQPSGPPAWMTTDATGEFELRQLPAGQILLMAHKPNPAGGIIRFPSFTRPRSGDDKIRIIIDPDLAEEVEDLDKPAIKKP
jgi:hypothetical protein